MGKYTIILKYVVIKEVDVKTSGFEAATVLSEGLIKELEDTNQISNVTLVGIKKEFSKVTYD